MYRLAIAAALTALGLWLPQDAHAQKIGVIDVQLMMSKVPAYTTAVDALRKDFEKKRAELQAKEAELAKVKQQLDAKITLTDPKTLEPELMAFQKQVMDFQRDLQQSQATISQREAELNKAMLGRVSDVTQRLGDSGDYAYVLEIGDELQPNVLFAGKGVDVTDKVLKLYKDTYGDKPILEAAKAAKAP